MKKFSKLFAFVLYVFMFWFVRLYVVRKPEVQKVSGKYIFYNNKKLTSYAQNILIYLVKSNLRNFEKLLAG